MRTKQVNHPLYHSTVKNGQRVRKLKRTELSYQRIWIKKGLATPVSQGKTTGRGTHRSKQSRSIPKLQKLHKIQSRKQKQIQNNESKNQYYTRADQQPNFLLKNQQQGSAYRNQKINSKKDPSKVGSLSINKSTIKKQSSYGYQGDSNYSQSSSFSQLSKSSSKLSRSNYQLEASSKQYQSQQFIGQSLKKGSFSRINQQSSNMYFNDSLSQIKQKNSKQQILENRSSSRQGNIFNQSHRKSNKICEGSIKDSHEYGQPEHKQHLLRSQERPIIPILHLHQSQKISENSDGNYVMKHTRRNSFKNLPLSSREPSHRSLRESTAYPAPAPNTFEEIIQRIEIHQYILALIMDFSQSTSELYRNQPDYKDFLCFLLHRKYFYECSNIEKTLKGGKNVFFLSNTEIPHQLLKEHLQSEKIRTLIRQQEEFNMNLFKKLQTMFRQIKHRFKDNAFVKLQTPNDNFTPQIVRILQQQLFEVYEGLLTSNITQNSQVQKQIRIIQIIEIVCLLSQLSGRKVKKIQFSQQIQDFDIYYEKNLPKITEAIEYFKTHKNAH